MTINTYVSPINETATKSQIGWKYYNSIKKKALESEFSLSGLILSISIAFFIVLITAYSLSLLHTSYKNTQIQNTINKNIYSLEKFHTESGVYYIQENLIDLSKTEDSANNLLA
ncbi:MAG: hypothetical protein US83_C0010G0032 [Candidatus Falkowbacteria bacterium GW2011_GWC2_38_22]|uniref:Uncharacterized protein n=1 Tax=Candidatus Falkowbacteria bacterium GW2011_GWE1_38_31 TaxID=1618638 RepID=A0A0G0JU92_9BACT|nr:MAG: hypothetical protein US73_C0005G0032 [Candidatus Falkowbacteria bacterium GW2011_GWF2_38_1205]KKQ60998.1 MAG: hypothetical protein US83_C0010G0032 [Candidatus Falkowbacteria bacterium GW2011_GWC2_38_22]KKQ63473.1 MAG: hypothetical protein US84_C0006G0076 [Candidatus Falkowbacteria bacterium GW2011_GWF1_38_22]KKQ65456.1 MAG: hypothetical protein US87_C0007G0032 [Candidatus Falkowbacteria bacterium GW2011_GWE2_38_254]KKQ70237.1 MAG: hypothetical protein US91_C0006G0076 [Candidatus Falkowb